MAETLPIPPFPAAEVRPSRQSLQQGTAVLRAELDAASDRSGQAILAHHLGRLFAHEQDFAAAAREELAATNLAAGFAAPLEALWGIAIRGRSRKNAETLLDRLLHIARTPLERERAGLNLAAQYMEERRHADARRVLEACLEGAPSSHAGWILLEELAQRELDLPLAQKALVGRAGGAGNDEVESLLYERAARLALELGELDEADALLEQALVTYPRWETLRRRERILLRAGRPDRAAVAALAALDHLQADLDGQRPGGSAPPPVLRSTAEIDAIRLRTAVLFAGAGEGELALEQIRMITSTGRAGALERALELSLTERTKAAPDRLQALDGAKASLADTDLASQAAIALWRWILDRGFDRSPDREGTGSTSPPEGLAESAGLLGLLLEDIERKAETEALPDLLERIARITPKAKGEERQRLLLAAAWIALTCRQIDRARRLIALARDDGAPEALRFAVELGLARHGDDVEGELSALEQLTDLSPTGAARELDAWLAFRCALRKGARTGEGAQESEDVRRTLRTLISACTGPTSDQAGADHAAREIPAPVRLAAWLWNVELPEGSGESGAFHSAEMVRAEGITRLLLASSDAKTWYEKTESALRAAPTDPLLAALALRAAEDAGAPVADRVALLTRFATLTDEPKLAKAARLRALLLLQAERAPVLSDAGSATPRDQAHTLLTELAGEPELDRLWMWILRSRTLTAPAALDDAAKRFSNTEPWLELEGALRQVAASDPLAPENLATLDLADSPRSEAARLLKLLVAVASGNPDAADSLSDASGLEDRTLGGLLLGAASHRKDAAASFLAAKRFHQLAPGLDSLLAYAVTARQCGRSDDEARARRALADELGAPELLAQAHLATGGGQLDHERPQRVLALAEGADQRAKAAIAWELCEAIGPKSGPARGRALELLGASIGGEMDGPLAQLMAGYQAIIAGNDLHALDLLLPLEHTLPDDAAVHLGLCAAAQRAGRADIEAASSAELARREADPAEAARLWERAGVLLQDALGAPDRAEAAFQSAMGRVPGSPLAFVRLYQLAHGRRDRPRMVELIDARLEAPTDEAKRISLLWEKARHCRQLGRRGVACRALEELLDLSSDHLPALALLAELQILDQRPDRAAPLLRRIALHPKTPPAERESAGLHAVDLMEKLAMSAEAMDLLVSLEALGLPRTRTRRRKARLAARIARWDVAATTFRELAEEDDDIPTRLEAARMLLAVERDHLRESANLKDAARLVLRDAPTDADAAAIVVKENFHPDERTRLLGPVREATLAKLQKQPLDLPVIGQMADFSEGLDNPREERAWLGAVALTGRLSDARQHRLEALTSSARGLPSGALGPTDLEHIAAPGQLGSMADLSRIIAPKIAKATLPDLVGLGVSETMRRDPFGSDGISAEVSAFTTALGLPQPQVYVGAVQAGTILLLPGEAPTIVLGAGTTTPLSAASRARLGYLLFAHTLDVSPLLQLGLDEARIWLAAVARLTSGALPDGAQGEVEERARQLARLLTSEERSELTRLASEVERSDRDLTDLPLTCMTSAARMATLIHGDPSILRQLRELIPDLEQERASMVGSVIQFLASPQMPTLRTKLGLDLT